jgi:hypothetical protein
MHHCVDDLLIDVVGKSLKKLAFLGVWIARRTTAVLEGFAGNDGRFNAGVGGDS